MISKEEWEELKDWLGTQLKPAIKGRRIKAIKVNSAYRWQPPLYIEVGKSCADLEQDGGPEEILAIYESTTFLVVTPEHGNKKGLPYFFAKQDVNRIVPLEV